jgi:hypothetical protein
MTAHLTVTRAGCARLIATGTTRILASQRNCPDPQAWATATAERLGVQLVGKQKRGRKPAKCRECGK